MPGISSCVPAVNAGMPSPYIASKVQLWKEMSTYYSTASFWAGMRVGEEMVQGVIAAVNLYISSHASALIGLSSSAWTSMQRSVMGGEANSQGAQALSSGLAAIASRRTTTSRAVMRRLDRRRSVGGTQAQVARATCWSQCPPARCVK